MRTVPICFGVLVAMGLTVGAHAHHNQLGCCTEACWSSEEYLKAEADHIKIEKENAEMLAKIREQVLKEERWEATYEERLRSQRAKSKE